MEEKKLVWHLMDIVKGDSDFMKRLKKLDNSVSRFDSFFENLSPDMRCSGFKEFVMFNESFGEEFARLSAYVRLLSSENIKSQKAMKYSTLLENLAIKAGDRKRPIFHWIKGLRIRGKKRLDDKNANRLFSAVPNLKHIFEYSRLSAKHTLPENEEKIIARKDMNGIDVVTELYEKITNDFRFEMTIGKKKRIFSLEEISPFFHSKNPDMRRMAYRSVMNVYGQNREKLFAIYSPIVKDWAIEAELRKYQSSISMRNFANELDDNIIDALINSCVRNRHIFWDFFRMKAKLLGMKTLARYDLHAPLGRTGKKIPFSDARKIVLSALNDFSPRFGEKAEMLFSGHIDSHPRKDKSTGGFWMSVTPKIRPYILLNYTGRPSDVTTLAHELGHAIHDIYASKNSISASHAPLPLCETASIFSEMIAFERILANSSAQEKLSLLSHKLTEFYATISRQNYFVKFELKAHRKIPEGITEEELSRLYLNNLKEEFGRAVKVPDEFRYEWSYVPHIFHTPFYCYAYSFGELLSLSLYSIYKEEGKKFISVIERILSAGGSRNPKDLLMESGLDISRRTFWDNGFKTIRTFIGEFGDIAK
ncbi:MAG: M3 family oligoendopeptidase [Candidatus Micrarchaeota archaeon]|nr:M3 family oligoendopeptidase [Candidatus Micrarchaeota archaeon]